MGLLQNIGNLSLGIVGATFVACGRTQCAPTSVKCRNFIETGLVAFTLCCHRSTTKSNNTPGAVGGQSRGREFLYALCGLEG